ncbi:hypothetical protein IB238_05485 [Rhizobium sp. ARZ01]|uniref:hypothetical protein n=1 Tax=Rhizobium sp. ARZ01 TaxID=2769313 RepID=UPI00177E2822|nr:hypothetical protein [Rhizobium sp. ARZ01]MBD9372081.1 hypothetical protein [Rhizobium sp. ARZ01]
MRLYVFFAALVLILAIAWKWRLIDPRSNRLRTSNDENRVGYALVTFVMIGWMIVNFTGVLPD